LRKRGALWLDGKEEDAVFSAKHTTLPVFRKDKLIPRMHALLEGPRSPRRVARRRQS